MSLNNSLNLLLLASTASHWNNSEKAFPQLVNSSFVIDVVSKLHAQVGFRNFVFYISERLHRDTDTATVFFQDFWDAFPIAPTVVINNNSKSMRGILSKPSLCLIMTTEWNDPIMELAALSLKRVRYFETMFLLFPIGISDKFYINYKDFTQFNDNIRFIYEWSWRKQFLNTMLITIHNNIYLYDPFPKGTVVNKTDNWTIEDFILPDKLNIKGREIKTPIRFDLPRVFCLRRFPNKGRITRLTGSSGKLLEAFITYINGTFNDSLIHEQEFEPYDVTTFMKQVETKQLEISVHSYTSMMNSTVGTSYPIGINDWCIMVPFRNSSPEHMYLERSFHRNSWFLLCFAVLYITMGIWLCSPLQQHDLSLSFLQSICSLLLIAPLKVITLPIARLRFLFVLLFVVGFCITNMYLSKMASYLTASSDQDQIDTEQDIVEANLNIMMLHDEYNMMLRKNYTNAFLDLIVPVSKQILSKHRDALNTSYGYTVSSDRWVFLNKQQDYLKKPLFRLTSMCIGPYYHVFPLQKDSYLMQPLKDFILAVQQTGYMFFWENEAFDDALFLGYVQMFKIDYNFTPLSIDFFRSLCYVWWLGLTLATLTFVLEVKGFTKATLNRAAEKFLNWLKGI
ncbi:uncharacterized protein ACRADG_009836 [Cochliomyia hominivorax]